MVRFASASGTPALSGRPWVRAPLPALTSRESSMPVVAAFELDDLLPAGETPGQPDAAHRRLCAAVDQADLFHRGNQLADHSRHVDFQGIGNAETQPVGRSGAHRGDYRVRRMPEDRRTPGANVINELPAFDREECARLRLARRKMVRRRRREKRAPENSPRQELPGWRSERDRVRSSIGIETFDEALSKRESGAPRPTTGRGAAWNQHD